MKLFIDALDVKLFWLILMKKHENVEQSPIIEIHHYHSTWVGPLCQCAVWRGRLTEITNPDALKLGVKPWEDQQDAMRPLKNEETVLVFTKLKK